MYAEMASSLSVFFSFHRECLYPLSLIQSNAEGHSVQKCSLKVEEEIVLRFLVRATYPRQCFKASFCKSGVALQLSMAQEHGAKVVTLVDDVSEQTQQGSTKKSNRNCHHIICQFNP